MRLLQQLSHGVTFFTLQQTDSTRAVPIHARVCLSSNAHKSVYATKRFRPSERSALRQSCKFLSRSIATEEDIRTLSRCELFSERTNAFGGVSKNALAYGTLPRALKV